MKITPNSCSRSYWHRHHPRALGFCQLCTDETWQHLSLGLHGYLLLPAARIPGCCCGNPLGSHTCATWIFRKANACSITLNQQGARDQRSVFSSSSKMHFVVLICCPVGLNSVLAVGYCNGAALILAFSLIPRLIFSGLFFSSVKSHLHTNSWHVDLGLILSFGEHRLRQWIRTLVQMSEDLGYSLLNKWKSMALTVLFLKG